MEIIDIAKKKEEAKKRMTVLGMSQQDIQEFMENGRISLIGEPGHCGYAEGEDLDRILDVEKEYDILVYAVIYGQDSNIGTTDSYLYVSSYAEEWEAERDDLQNGTAWAYVYNRTIPLYSELGAIGVGKMPCGALVRTW